MKPYYSSAQVTLYQGDCLEVMRSLPDESINCCVTSPPYWGLRDYGVDGQIGLESTPQEFVAKMVEVFEEVKRVLAKDGTCWLNLGDSYAGSWGNYSPTGKGGQREKSTERFDRRAYSSKEQWKPPTANKIPGLKPKDLCMIPHRVAIALQDAGWWVRSDIVWAKPNPMPESVTDRPTRSHEYIFLLTKSDRYYYNAEAISEIATSGDSFGKGATGRGAQAYAIALGCNGRHPQQDHSGWMGGNGKTRNKRSVWTIATTPCPDAHFAVFPQELPRLCILAGCPEGGTVLDPFCGSGTTAYVAQELGRKAISIDLNPQYLELAVKRCQQQTIFGALIEATA